MSQYSEPADEPARAAIRPVKERVEHELIARPGVVGVDIAEKETAGEKTGELSIVVFVEHKVSRTDLPESDVIPEEIDGIRTDVQEMIIELQTALKLEGEQPLLDTATYSPLVGGISIGPQRSVYLTPPDVPSPGNYIFVGTLGAMVKDRSTGATMALTNFHVACVNNTWSVGDRMVQPSRVDNSTNTEWGDLDRAVLNASVDGAVITLDSGASWSASVTGVGNVEGQGTATAGMAVQKRGRTTEHTFGTVQSTDFTLSVDYGSDVGVQTFTHQLRIQTDTSKSARFSDKGDSGSVVMDEDRNIVGLLFAGSTDGTWTFANPIQAALDALDVDLLTPPILTFTKPLVFCPASKLIICGELPVSRIVLCKPSKLTLCPSRITLCMSRVLCPSKPVFCDYEIPDIPDFPWEIPGRRYGSGAVPDADAESYWAGYLTALEEVAALEADVEAGSDSADRKS